MLSKRQKITDNSQASTSTASQEKVEENIDKIIDENDSKENVDNSDIKVDKSDEKVGNVKNVDNIVDKYDDKKVDGEKADNIDGFFLYYWHIKR